MPYQPNYGQDAQGYSGYVWPPPAQAYQRNGAQYPIQNMVQPPPTYHQSIPSQPYEPASPQTYQQLPTQFHAAPVQYPPSYQPPYQPSHSQESITHVLQGGASQQWHREVPPQQQPIRGEYYPEAPRATQYVQTGAAQVYQSPPQTLPLPPQNRNGAQPSASIPQVRDQYTQQPLRLQQHQQPSHRLPPALPQAPPAQAVSRQRIAHVEIPVQRSYLKSHESQVAHAPKRRRSNDGSAVPVCDTALLQKQSSSQHLKQIPPSSSPLTELNSSQIPATPPQLNVDYQAVLLSLADEYVSHAYNMGSMVASPAASDDQIEEYRKLLATAMACLESALKNYRQPDPRKEARIRLRLASLMLDETDNYTDTAEVLNKGITLCERNRLPDMKYAMHHLTVRVLFKSSPKAALKTVDKLVDEVEALNIVHWIYAFRFLRVSLNLQRSSHADTSALRQHISAIASYSGKHRHTAAKLMAAAAEAVVSIRSCTVDAVEVAHRALATARTHQLGSEMQQLPQLRALLECLDLACNIVHFNADQLTLTLEQMHTTMDTATRDAGWSKDGRFLVPLGTAANRDVDIDTAGILKQSNNGEYALTFQWLPREQLYVLGFLLSGTASLHKNNVDGKAEEYLKEGLKLTVSTSQAGLGSLVASRAGIDRMITMNIALRLQLIFAYCGRSEWLLALDDINKLKEDSLELVYGTDPSTVALLRYLEAICEHGLGQQDSALTLYRSSDLLFDKSSKEFGALRDLRALATLNSILIIRPRSQDDSIVAGKLLDQVESYCLNHHNKAFVSAYWIVKSTFVNVSTTIIKNKQYLQRAIQNARTAMNNQLLTILMNTMTDSFFVNIVGQQAEGSARLGRTLAKKEKSKLWMAVADGMLKDTLELCGKPQEADAATIEGREAYDKLPESLREALEHV